MNKHNPIFSSSDPLPGSPPKTEPGMGLLDSLQEDDVILATKATTAAPVEQLALSLVKGVVLHVEHDGVLIREDNMNTQWLPAHIYTFARFLLLTLSLTLCSCQTRSGWSIGVGFNKLTGNIGVNFTKLPDTVVINTNESGLPPVVSGKSPIVR